jgi:hypothetical protein
MPRLGRVLVIGIAVITGVAVVNWLSKAAGTQLNMTRHVAEHSLELDIPFAWDVNTLIPPSTGFGSTFAVLGTQPWGPCLPFDINCHYQQRLGPSQISVELALGGVNEDFCEVGASRSDLAGRGAGDPVPTGRLMRIDGRPVIQTDYDVRRLDYYHSDEWRDWRIAAPGTTFYVYDISARYQGPDTLVFRSQLDAMIASITITPDPQLGDDDQADCGAPFPS